MLALVGIALGTITGLLVERGWAVRLGGVVRRAVSLIDPYVEQVKYPTGELEASRQESRAAREESATLRTELASP